MARQFNAGNSALASTVVPRLVSFGDSCQGRAMSPWLRGLASRACPIVFGAFAVSCASAFDGAPTSFVYRLTSVHRAAESCDASAGADVTASTAESFFVVRDFGPFAKASSCASEDVCKSIAQGIYSDASATPAWAFTVPSFSFSPDVAALGACRGEAVTASSTAVGASTIRIDVLVRTVDQIPRETDGTCSTDYVASKAPTLPCGSAVRYEGSLFASY